MTVTALPITVDGLRGLMKSGGLVGYGRDSDLKKLAAVGTPEEIRAWGEGNGFEIIDHFHDFGISAQTPAEHRPGLQAALSALSRPGAVGMALTHLDRLARDPELMLHIVETLWDLDRDVYVCGWPRNPEERQGKIPRTRQGRVHVVRMGVRAMTEREDINGRLHAGRRFKGQQGGNIGGVRNLEHPKYGYRLERMPDGTEDWVPDEGSEAWDVRCFIRQTAQTLGYRPTLRLVNERGIVRPDGKLLADGTPAPWALSTVVKFAKKPEYRPPFSQDRRAVYTPREAGRQVRR
jgi:DNA invertase Pin-like site-specific DNA recombinase